MKEHSKLKWTIGVVILVILGFAAIFYIGNKDNNSKDGAKTIKVGVTGTSFPTAYKENGKLVGFDVDVMNAAAKKAGYKVKWVTGEFDGLLGQLDNGSLDTVANDIAITPQRKQKYDFSKIYNQEETTVAVNSKSSYKKIHDLDGKFVSGAAASNNTANLQNYDKKIKIKSFDARDLTFEALLSGHVDGVVNTKNNLKALIKAKKYNWRVLEDSAATVNVALPFAKNNSRAKELRVKLDKAIEELLKDGTIGKISQKYFGYDETKDLK